MSVERKVMEPRLIEHYPTWKELADRGSFESGAGILLGRIPNPEDFAKYAVEADRNQRNVPFENETNLDQEELPEVLRPAFEAMKEDVQQSGCLEGHWELAQTKLDLAFARSNSYYDPTSPHVDIDPFRYIAHEVVAEYNRRPGAVWRYTVSTVQGTSFYPGIYHLSNLQENTFAKGITSQTTEPVYAPPFVVSKFSGIDVHSEPIFQDDAFGGETKPDHRFVFSAAFFPVGWK